MTQAQNFDIVHATHSVSSQPTNMPVYPLKQNRKNQNQSATEAQSEAKIYVLVIDTLKNIFYTMEYLIL